MRFYIFLFRRSDINLALVDLPTHSIPSIVINKPDICLYSKSSSYEPKIILIMHEIVGFNSKIKQYEGKDILLQIFNKKVVALLVGVLIDIVDRSLHS